ncbi:MAG: hypothetical protein BYD32DRAFT_429486 [Podila humilis]|nr:MAG: hypothetical protein BYD32DRAFT_429486 [Podila humilis]
MWTSRVGRSTKRVLFRTALGHLGPVVAKDVLLLQIHLGQPPCLAIMEVVVAIVSVVVIETTIAIGIGIRLFDHC